MFIINVWHWIVVALSVLRVGHIYRHIFNEWTKSKRTKLLWTFPSCEDYEKKKTVFLLCRRKRLSPACQNPMLLGFIKESSEQLFPAVQSWDMTCGTCVFALPDLNAMWQAVGSKTGPVLILAQVALTCMTNNNRSLTDGWWRVGNESIIS